jgi:hypothetical protein
LNFGERQLEGTMVSYCKADDDVKAPVRKQQSYGAEIAAITTLKLPKKLRERKKAQAQASGSTSP